MTRKSRKTLPGRTPEPNYTSQMLTSSTNELHAKPARKSPRRGRARGGADKTAPFITQRPGWRLFSVITGVKFKLINHRRTLASGEEPLSSQKRVNDCLMRLFSRANKRHQRVNGVTPLSCCGSGEPKERFDGYCSISISIGGEILMQRFGTLAH